MNLGTASTATVKFGAAGAFIVTDTGTQIVAVSPAGTGTVDVTVTTAAGTSATSAADRFTYTTIQTVPTVTGISPTCGPLSGGSSVTVSGTGFTGATAILFGGVPAAGFTSVSATQITAVSPAGVGVVNVTVSNGVGTSAPSAADQFTYVGAPAVTDISPASGPTTGGTQVTISGTDLGNSSMPVVKFGAAVATVISDNGTQIVVVSPPGTAGAVDVVVATAGGMSTMAATDKFTYFGIPAVTHISPAAGPVGGGTQVTITGTNLGAATVKFGAAVASIVSDSSTQIVATSPAGTAGTVDVTVRTGGGASAPTAADKFTYTATPVVAGVSPASGPTAGGTQVTITGANLGAANTATVKFGAAVATIVSDTGTQIVVVNPASSAGAVDVTVTTAGGASTVSTADRFTYTTAPIVSTVNPTSGPAAGGTQVTIRGVNLSAARSVKFGKATAKILNDTATQVVAISPKGTAGTVDVTVTTANGTSAVLAADQFTYVAAPTVTQISPASGSAAGGTQVTITGTGLGTANTATVKFGAAVAAIVSDTGTLIVVTSPAGTGTVNVTVTTAGGASAVTSADRFTYTAPALQPSASRRSPPRGAAPTPRWPPMRPCWRSWPSPARPPTACGTASTTCWRPLAAVKKRFRKR